MGFLTREDLPFHYALADAYTVGDDYHCSVISATGPNRIYLMSGTINADQSHPGYHGTAPHSTDPLLTSGGWHDLTVTASSDASWSQRFLGHLENGRPSITGA